MTYKILCVLEAKMQNSWILFPSHHQSVLKTIHRQVPLHMNNKPQKVGQEMSPSTTDVTDSIVKAREPWCCFKHLASVGQLRYLQRGGRDCFPYNIEPRKYCIHGHTHVCPASSKYGKTNRKYPRNLPQFCFLHVECVSELCVKL